MNELSIDPAANAAGLTMDPAANAAGTSSEQALTMEIVDFTAEMATAFLERNTGNRNPKQYSIALYAKDMANGRWRLTGEAIKIDRNGNLVDGQNRCMAMITAAGLVDQALTVPMLIIRGVEPETQDAMDSGAPRTVADQFARKGVPSYARAAALTKLVLMYEKGDLLRRKTPTRLEIIEYYQANKELIDEIAMIEIDHQNSSCITASIRGAARMILVQNGSDEALIAEFFTALGTGADLPKGSPILALRGRMQSARNSIERVRPHEQMVMIFRAWNAWRRGETLDKFPIRFKGALVTHGELVR